MDKKQKHVESKLRTKISKVNSSYDKLLNLESETNYAKRYIERDSEKFSLKVFKGMVISNFIFTTLFLIFSLVFSIFYPLITNTDLTFTAILIMYLGYLGLLNTGIHGLNLKLFKKFHGLSIENLFKYKFKYVKTKLSSLMLKKKIKKFIKKYGNEELNYHEELDVQIYSVVEKEKETYQQFLAIKKIGFPNEYSLEHIIKGSPMYIELKKESLTFDSKFKNLVRAIIRLTRNEIEDISMNHYYLYVKYFDEIENLFKLFSIGYDLEGEPLEEFRKKYLTKSFYNYLTKLELSLEQDFEVFAKLHELNKKTEGSEKLAEAENIFNNLKVLEKIR